MLVAPNGNHMQYVLQLCFEGATNNVAKYEALLHDRRSGIVLGICIIVIHGNSKLVINQVTRDLVCKGLKMEVYCFKVRKLESKFDGMELCHIPQSDNDEFDSLTRLSPKWRPDT